MDTSDSLGVTRQARWEEAGPGSFCPLHPPPALTCLPGPGFTLELIFTCQIWMTSLVNTLFTRGLLTFPSPGSHLV